MCRVEGLWGIEWRRHNQSKIYTTVYNFKGRVCLAFLGFSPFRICARGKCRERLTRVPGESSLGVVVSSVLHAPVTFTHPTHPPHPPTYAPPLKAPGEARRRSSEWCGPGIDPPHPHPTRPAAKDQQQHRPSNPRTALQPSRTTHHTTTPPTEREAWAI